MNTAAAGVASMGCAAGSRDYLSGMGLHYSFVEDPEENGALMLPYQSNFEEGRRNHGFRDLRGQPEEAAKVAEAQPSDALRSLLVSLARPGAPFFSAGCELGAHKNDDGTFGAGGYIQVVSSDLHGVALDRRYHTAMSDAVEAHLNRRAGSRSWEVEFSLSVVGPQALGGPDQVWSPVIYFSAADATLDGACVSSDELLDALRAFFNERVSD